LLERGVDARQVGRDEQEREREPGDDQREHHTQVVVHELQRLVDQPGLEQRPVEPALAAGEDQQSLRGEHGAERDRQHEQRREQTLAPEPVPQDHRDRDRREHVEQRRRQREPHRDPDGVEHERVAEDRHVVGEGAAAPLLLHGRRRLDGEPDAVGERVDEQRDRHHEPRHQQEQGRVDAPLREPVPQARGGPLRVAGPAGHAATSCGTGASSDSGNTSTRSTGAVSRTAPPTAGGAADRAWSIPAPRCTPTAGRRPLGRPQGTGPAEPPTAGGVADRAWSITSPACTLTACSRPWYSTTATVPPISPAAPSGPGPEPATAKSSGRTATRTRSPARRPPTARPVSRAPPSSPVPGSSTTASLPDAETTVAGRMLR